MCVCVGVCVMRGRWKKQGGIKTNIHYVRHRQGGPFGDIIVSTHCFSFEPVKRRNRSMNIEKNTGNKQVL